MPGWELADDGTPAGDLGGAGIGLEGGRLTGADNGKDGEGGRLVPRLPEPAGDRQAKEREIGVPRGIGGRWVSGNTGVASMSAPAAHTRYSPRQEGERTSS